MRWRGGFSQAAAASSAYASGAISAVTAHSPHAISAASNSIRISWSQQGQSIVIISGSLFVLRNGLMARSSTHPMSARVSQP